MLSTRAAAVAAAVPPLRSIIIRALHTTPTTSEYAQAPRAGPGQSSSRPSFRPSTSSDSSARFADRPSRSRAGSLAPIERPRGPGISSAPQSYTVENLGRIGEEEEDATEGQVDTSDRERGEFIYHHKPRRFAPNTYPVPESAMSKDQAQPTRFERFALDPALVDSMRERYGVSGHTTHIQSLSLGHFCGERPADSDADSEEVSTRLAQMKNGQRVILGAETGSGKTLAYLLPLMHHLKATEAEANEEGENREEAIRAKMETKEERFERDRMLFPRSIVLSPTHELNRQSTATAKSLTHGIKLRVAGLSNTKEGGTGGARGVVDCLFSTGAMLRRMFGIRKPGMEIEEGYESTEWVGVDRVEWLVIDEADIMLSRDFRQETLLMLNHILATRPNLNIILTTATFPPDLLNLLRSHEDFIDKPFTHLLSPALHKLPRNLEARFIPRSKGDLVSDVAHEVRRVLAEDALKRMQMGLGGKITDRSKVIVFCNSDSKVRKVSAELTSRDLPNLTWTKEGENRKMGSSGALKGFLTDPKASSATPVSGASEEEQKARREKELEGTPRILVTTGILSRGLDFSPNISTVFLVDQPKDILDFIHRAGRAGRAGRKGRVVIFGSAQGRSAQDGKLGSMIRDSVADRRSHEDKLRLEALERERRAKIGKESGWWGREAEKTKAEKAKRREEEQRARERERGGSRPGAVRASTGKGSGDGKGPAEPWWVTNKLRAKGKPKRG